MYLLIYTLRDHIEKGIIEAMISKNDKVSQASWIGAENMKEKEFNDLPSIGGSIKSLFRNKEQDILLARVEEKATLDTLISQINEAQTTSDLKDYLVIPLVS